MAADDQSKISFSIPPRIVAMATNFCWLIHRTEFLSFGDIRQMAVAYGNRNNVWVAARCLM